MPVCPIVLFPDPILRAHAAPANPGDFKTDTAVANLRDTLAAQQGVGIAAPQINVGLRIIAVDASRAKRPVENHGLLILLNPVILYSNGTAEFREGCMSLPDLVAKVPRHNEVGITAQLPNGTQFTCTARGFEAVIIQHEIDHLDGVLFIDRVKHARDIKFRV